jgi:hypothetical protein
MNLESNLLDLLGRIKSGRYRERGSSMKNRKREIRTSGSVRDEDGRHPHLLGRHPFLLLTAGSALLLALSSTGGMGASLSDTADALDR